MAENTPCCHNNSIPPRLIVEIPPRIGDAVGQGKRRAAIVSPLAWGETVRTATAIAGDFGEAVGHPRLNGSPKAVTESKAEEGSPAQTAAEQYRPISAKVTHSMFVRIEVFLFIE